MSNSKLPQEVAEYIDIVRNGEYPQCEEQYLFADYIERIFDTEDLFFNREQADAYLAYQKYFPFDLFPWEKCLFVLHNCVYRTDDQLRWPEMFALIGRGAGKNGYLSYEDFCLLTPTNGIMNYDIDLCANSEQQARRSFDDIYEILESRPKFFSKFFRWTKECITNIKTNSSLRYRTTNAKTKDGLRPGKVDFDEEHAYEGYSEIEVYETALGKVKHPRITKISTDGKVRGGPLDDDKATARQILKGEIEDNGFLPFICKLDSIDEIDDEKNWHKANPSLRYNATLLGEYRREYRKYKMNPSTAASFVIKRMNLPQDSVKETAVTSWENLLAASEDFSKESLSGLPCVFGIDYSKTNDFVAAGVLILKGGRYHWITHTWVCAQSADLHRIRAPLKEWEAAGLLTFVDDVEISPEIPASWVADKASEYMLTIGAIDLYRYTLLAKALKTEGLDADKGGANNIQLIRKSNIMLNAPSVISLFSNKKIVWGENPLMRWYTNNAYQAQTRDGNITFEKIEPRSRKTDGFMALVHALCVADTLKEEAEDSEYDFNIYSY